MRQRIRPKTRRPIFDRDDLDAVLGIIDDFLADFFHTFRDHGV